MRSTGVLCALLVGILALGLPAAASEDEIAWITKVKKAFDESSAGQKPVFVDVWAVWCQPCKQMDATTYRQPAILEAMEKFVPLKVDQDSSENFCERHAVEALPLVLYLDADGREIGRRAGLQLEAELLASMNQVSAGYASYLDNVDRSKESAEAADLVADYLARSGNPRGAIALLKRAIKLPDAGDRTEELALALAQAQLEAGDAKAAGVGFQRLAEHASTAEMRGQALEGLLRSQRERGRDDDADETLQRLAAEFPDLAARAGK